MSCLVRSLACGLLALTAGMMADNPAANDRDARSERWVQAAARQAQEAQRRQREARLRWEYERRRSAAHARMPNTLYASTPGLQAKAEFSCPALVDEDTRRLYRGFLEGRRETSKPLTASDMVSGKSWRNAGINVFPVQRQGSSSSVSWRPVAAPKADGLRHLIPASAWTPAKYQSKSALEGSQHVYLFPSASEPLREGFVRVINHSAEAGEVSIDPSTTAAASSTRSPCPSTPVRPCTSTPGILRPATPVRACPATRVPDKATGDLCSQAPWISRCCRISAQKTVF